MTTLVCGATGATGRLVAGQLLSRGEEVKVIVRNPDDLPEYIKNNDRVSIICGSILELEDNEMIEYVKDCNAVVSCLGHNLSFKGVFGRPRRLVTDAVKRLCAAIKSSRPKEKTKFVLMNTTGNRNQDLDEKVSFAQSLIVGSLRLLFPPHADNEEAADYLRTIIGQNDSSIEWVAVRPDSLTDKNEITETEVFPSPTRSAIFDPGKTSRINAAGFMTDLILDPEKWYRWKGQMPVLYNKFKE